MAKKGFYIKSSRKDSALMLNLFVSDFKAFLDTIPTNEGWVKLRIFERDKMDDRGYTHNIEVVLDKSLLNKSTD